MLDRTAATRLTRIAQVGAVGAVALSAAAVVVTLPGQKVEHPPEAVVIPAPEVKDTPAATVVVAKADGRSTGTRMARIANKPAPAVVIPPDPPPVDPAPPPVVVDITYHGIVTIGDRALALLKHNAKQRFVKIGDKVGEEAVEEIRVEHVRLGAAHIIPLAERAGGATSRLQNAPGMPAGAMAHTLAPSPVMMDDAIAEKMARFGNGGAPAYVPPEDVAIWRRMRAQMVLSGEHGWDSSLDETAYKLMQDRREKLQAEGMTPQEYEAEQAYFEKSGQARERAGEKR
jgi:hypothetical protein